MRFDLWIHFERPKAIEAGGGGDKIGHKSNQIFTSWKYEKEKESTEEDMVGDIVIELGGGMNCLALGLKKRGFGKKISRYISAENNDRARVVAKVANPITEEFCSIDHEWGSDAWQIQEEHIAALG